jgi:hypothetical protein
VELKSLSLTLAIIASTAVATHHNGHKKFFQGVLQSCQNLLLQSMKAITQLSMPSSTIDSMFNSIPSLMHLLDLMLELKSLLLLEKVSRMLMVQLLTTTFCSSPEKSVRLLNVPESKQPKCKLNLTKVLLRQMPKEKRNKKLSRAKTQMIPLHNSKDS